MNERTMAKKQDIVLKVENVVNRFGKQTVHDGVNLEIRRGEIVGIVGGSGTGKSVLLKTILGLRKPDSGKVTIEGRPVEDIKPSELAALFGVLFQQGALFSSMTVAHNITVPLNEHTDLSEEDCARIAQLKIGLVGLPPETGAKYPDALSGGMIKRAALARALALDPNILFLDEPTSGLDPVAADQFDQLIVDLNHTLGATVVMITHDLDSLFGICTRVAVLIDKKMVIDTLPNLLKNDHPWIKEYFQGPRARGAAMAAKETHSENAHGNG